MSREGNDAGRAGVDGGIDVRVPFRELVAALSDPAAFAEHLGRAVERIELAETHISVVFLAGDRAFKVKRPLRLWGFLDYGTLGARRQACEGEVRLNRRLAGDIYLGVVPIVRRTDGRLVVGGEGEVVEHAVEMRRFREEDTFEARLARGTLDADAIGEAARVLAGFHRAHRLLPAAAGLARPSRFGKTVRQNFAATRRSVPVLFPASAHDGILRAMARRLFAGRGRIRRRLREGRMVDGHGDVRLEHVLAWEGEVRIVDCVEFTPRLRHGDPLSDMAFLSMELTARGRRDLADAFERAYLEAADESGEDAAALLPLYLAYRAHVRAKVDAQTCDTPDLAPERVAAKAHGARKHLALAWTYARRGEVPPVVLMRGPSGAGKSVLAADLAPLFGARVIRSDEVRKALAGHAPTWRPTEAERAALYGPEASRRTYARVLELGLATVATGRIALLDATYLRADARAAAFAAVSAAGATLLILDLQVGEETIRERLARRAATGTDASDADFAVYRAQIAEADALDPLERARTVTVTAEDAPDAVALRLIDVLEGAR